ncbi:MAG: ribbon-helix-helix domain-containing protein [Eubacteriales bacterium]|nr:ribbon-helix-helix domain-containing protein [Eubacteriales bacterium]
MKNNSQDIIKSGKSKNFTFTLPESLVEKIREYAEEKYIPSINYGVKEALTEYICSTDREILKESMSRAAQDPLFMKDLEDCMNDFKKTDDESCYTEGK